MAKNRIAIAFNESTKHNSLIEQAMAAIASKTEQPTVASA
jgi:hypothetical protein